MFWQGKTVLITGASSGLGRGVALHVAAKGAHIVATARRVALLESLKAEVEALGVRCEVVPADATDPAQAQRVLDQAIQSFGRVDVALLNAGGGAAQVMGETTREAVCWEMRVNYDTVVNFLCPLIAHMKDQGGTIATTSSPAGFFGLPKSGPYSASKAATRILFDSCRVELADTPLRFVTLYPGFTYTDGLNPEDVPVKALIISKERAVGEMAWAMEKGKERHMFPKRIGWLIKLAGWFPVGWVQSLLGVISRR